MKNTLTQLFKNIAELEPPIKLVGFIFSQIEKEKIKKAKRQLIFSYLGLFSSGALAIFALTIFGQAFWQSEFWTMLSLIFSDIAIVAKNWDTFLMSLLETFPVVHAAILLVPVFLVLVSANCYFANRANCKYKFNFNFFNPLSI
jgi:hypothetical protein